MINLLSKFLRPKRAASEGDPRNRFTRDKPELKGYDIGEWTYGTPRVLTWQPDCKLTIGKFCSIAGDVTILLGGEHFTNRVTTYPFAELLPGRADLPKMGYAKGDVVIGNDVWIGHGAKILSGVTIGHGAVIGANSLVTRDVPDYAVAGGNPARVLRQRFSEEQIARLLDIAWWNWPDKEVFEKLPLILSDGVERFIDSCVKESSMQPV